MQTINQTGNLPRHGVRFLKLAVVYLIVGLFLGLAMAITGNFQLRSVHVHLNLLGWATLALAGIVYCVIPHLAETRIAAWHFWLHNAGLPVMMLALSFYHLGYTEFEPLIGIGSVMTITGLLLFALNLFQNIEKTGSPVTQPMARPLSE